jgi:hypothetical protein
MVVSIVELSKDPKDIYTEVYRKLNYSPFVSKLDSFTTIVDGKYYQYLTFEPTFFFIKATYVGLALAAITYILAEANIFFYICLSFCFLDYFNSEDFIYRLTRKALERKKYDGEIRKLDHKEGFKILWAKLK